ncbi:hypothetical protein [Streptomyces mangrovi]|uniref:Uncharacterized protein n=1 Tax=Streptomyces pini TaxID=1520580 RepID=A0A1I3ZLX4_9ACTN|nr:hypothetical protein SAMN05192584_10662 [Streptomyces pini]
MLPHELGTEALRQSMVESLMRVIGLPDDEDTAREADDVLQSLDARLRAEPTAA